MDRPSFSDIQTLGVLATTATTPTKATGPRQDQTPPLSSQWPSSEQQRGIAALSALKDPEIFSVLASLRSLPSQLTDQHVKALVCLRSAPDDYVKRWLEYDRRCSGADSTVQSERSSTLSSFSDSPFSTASCSTNNTSLPDLSSPPSKTVDCPNSNGIAQISSTQRHVRVTADLNKPQPPIPQIPSDGRLTAPESQSSTHGARHERWCTTREHKNAFTTYGGFAKHENEHDNYYVFLPQGPIENTPWGPQCALCEATNPSKAHLREHNTLKYDGWIGKPITRSRRGNFEELLRKHNTSEEKIKVLLNKWRKDPEKKAYACGFCVRLFRTLPDRTSHIDREHYAKGEHIRDWNDTLVIKGLLLQQELLQECLRLFNPVDPTLVETKISWPPSAIEDLQLRLELRQERAKDLAIDVFRKASKARLSSSRRRHKLSDSCSYTESGKFIETSTLTQRPTKLDRSSATNPIQSPIQNNSPLQGLHAQRQVYHYDQNTMGISHMPALSLPPHQQLSETNSALPILSVGPAPNSSGSAGFIHGMSNDPFGAEGSTSEAPPDLLASSDSPYLGVNELNSLDDSYFVRMSPDSDPLPLSFDAPAPEVVLHTSSQLENYPDDTTQDTFQSSRPKRKLSDKSAKEANSKAQTQSPVAKYKQGYSLPKW